MRHLTSWFLPLAGAALLAGCRGGEGLEHREEIAHAAGDLMASFDEAVQGGGLALRPTLRRPALERKPLHDYLGELLVGTAWGASCSAVRFPACAQGTLVKDFGGCTLGSATYSGEVRLTFSSPDCTLAGSGASVTHEPNYSITGKTGATFSVSAAGGGQRITRAADGFVYSMPGIRRWSTSAGGKTLTDVSSRTLADITVSGANRANRVMNGGRLELENTVAGYTVTLVPENLAWTSGCNCAASGRLSGAVVGAAGKGKAVTVELTGCGTANLTVDGETSAVELDRCAAVTSDAPDGGSDGGVPMIGEVLACGRVGQAGGLNDGGELQRYDFDGAEYPDALCNDGTPAFLYFRPAAAAAARNRWVIQLQGGGTCWSPKTCAERWCNRGTRFGMQGMSALPSPRGINGNGILDRRPANPLSDFNQVFVRYCSSDGWTGTRRDIVVEGPNPLDGGVIAPFRMHMLGSRIVDATLDLLGRDAGGLVFQVDGGAPVALPDLDEAELVVLAGASAGGIGTIQNADRIGAALRGRNVRCSGDGGCPLGYRAIIDSIFIPSLEDLDLSTGPACDAGLFCTYRERMDQSADAGEAAFLGMRPDQSCLDWHAANAPQSRSFCFDKGHVARHHLTTPFLMRMGQTDQLLGPDLVSEGFSAPDAGPLTMAHFAMRVNEELRALANLPSTAEEGAQVSVVPATFGPTCSDHETLFDNVQVFQVEIDAGVLEPDGGVASLAGGLKLFDVAARWFSASGPYHAVAPDPANNHCPP